MCPAIGSAVPPAGASDALDARVRTLLGHTRVDSHAYEYLLDLCDGIGARLTGSDEERRARQWALRQMQDLGLATSEDEWRLKRAWKRGYARAALRAPMRMSALEQIGTLPGGAAPDFSLLFGKLLPAPADYAVTVLPWSSTAEQVRDRRRSQSQWQTTASLSHTAGAHQWKIGADWRRMSAAVDDRPVSASLLFTDTVSLDNGFAAILRIARRRPVKLALHNLSLFAQDTFKAGPRATISLGMRWEFNPAPDGRSGTALWKTRYSDFAPRAGLALRLNRSGSWTLRTGAGLYYGLAAGSVFGGLALLPDSLAVATIPGVSLNAPQPVALPEFGATSGLFNVDTSLRMPVTVQWNATLERRLGRAAALSAGWVGAAGRRLLRSEFSALSGAPRNVTGNFAKSDYQSLQVQGRVRAAPGLDVMANYAWAHSIDNASRDTQIFLAVSRAIDRGSSDFDVRHGLTLAFLYALPDSGPRLLRGWYLDGIVRARTGFPFQPYAVIFSADPVEFGSPAAYRPDFDASQPVWVNDGRLPGGRALNPAAFPVQSTFRQGTLGRNSLRGFPFRQADLALQKHFDAGHGALLVVRIEAFNVTNTPNFSPPYNLALTPPPYPPAIGWPLTTLDRDLGAGGPGSGLTPVFQVGGMRSIQASVRVQF